MQSKPARGERKVFSVDAQRQLWAAAASTTASGFPGGSDAYVQVRGHDRTVDELMRDAAAPPRLCLRSASP